METDIKITTLEHVPNLDIEEHIGLVAGSYTIKQGTLATIVATLKNFFGGEVKEVDDTFTQARNNALEEMKKEAIKLGANTIINVRFESARLSNGYCEVHVYGSAVKGHTY